MAYKDYPFYFGATAKIFERARALRKISTEAEKILWKQLKAKKFSGLKFRRQHPINKFIADFFCDKLNLIIEIDGGIHQIEEVEERDIAREKVLKEFGFTILRFTNNDIIYNIDFILNKIELFIMHNSSLSNMERESKGKV